MTLITKHPAVKSMLSIVMIGALGACGGTRRTLNVNFGIGYGATSYLV